MAEKQNCWEFKNCGREPGGKEASHLGVCSAANTKNAAGLNGGKNGGRICWAIAGTLCGDKVQGEFAHKHLTCLTCDFFLKVNTEEGTKFKLLVPNQQQK